MGGSEAPPIGATPVTIGASPMRLSHNKKAPQLGTGLPAIPKDAFGPRITSRADDVRAMQGEGVGIGQNSALCGDEAGLAEPC
jgi:hypothetical protein